MLKQVWLAYIRSSLSRPGVFALNLIGMALGLGMFLVLVTAVRADLSWNKWISDSDRIARVNLTMATAGGSGVPEALTPGAIAPLIREDFAEVSEVTRIRREQITILVDGRPTHEELHLVDSNFFSVFPYPAAWGDPTRAIQQPDGLVLDEATALKVLGTTEATNRTLAIVVGTKKLTFKVIGVLKAYPATTTVRPRIIAQLRPELFQSEAQLSIFSRWGSSTLQTWVKLKPSATFSSLASGLSGFVARRATDIPPDLFTLSLTPLLEVHLSDGEAGIQSDTPSASPLLMTALSWVAILALIISVVNYTNLQTARSATRAKEIALRRAIGASRFQVGAQMLIEAVLTAMLASTFGIAFAELTLPLINSFLGTSLKLTYFGLNGVIVISLVTAVVCGFLAGIYPAFIISGFQPAAVFSSGGAPVKGRTARRFREALVGLQFTSAVGLATAAMIMVAQSDHAAHTDLGFARDHLSLIREAGDPAVATRLPALVYALSQVQGVEAVGLSNRSPAGTSTTSVEAYQPGDTREPATVVVEQISPGALKALNVTVIAGRSLSEQLGNDVTPMSLEGLAAPDQAVMINESAARLLGFGTPSAAINKPLRVNDIDVTVAGVIRNIRFNGPREQVQPVITFLTFQNIDAPTILVRTRGLAESLNRDQLIQGWTNVASDVPVTLISAKEAMESLILSDKRQGLLFAWGALGALVIGAIGLFGLAIFTVSSRTREMGIRKALGAKSSQVFWSILLQFMTPILIAIPLGWALGWLSVAKWLGQFAERSPLTISIFLVPALSAVFISLSTVVWHAASLAEKSPAEALR